jgi:hypothetical protein
MKATRSATPLLVPALLSFGAIPARAQDDDLILNGREMDPDTLTGSWLQ